MLDLPSFVSKFRSTQKSTFFQPILLALVLPPDNVRLGALVLAARAYHRHRQR